jgi:hypothetical protein
MPHVPIRLVRLLVRTVAAGDNFDRAKQDHEIQTEAPLQDVPAIELDPLVIRQSIPTTYLPQAR